MKYEDTIRNLEIDNIFLTAEREWEDCKLDMQQKVNDYMEEFRDEWKKKKKIENLTEEIEELKRQINGWGDSYKKSFERNDPQWCRELINEWRDKKINKLKKVKNRLFFVKNSDKIGKDKITSDMIGRAKQYPVENIIRVNSAKFARCTSPNHEDKNPSMFVKGNYGYCFSCNYSADVIKIAMDVNGLNFAEAVKKLACG